MIVLEEEVLPTADFLQFMAQCLNVLVKDTSLIGVSAWNDNGECRLLPQRNVFSTAACLNTLQLCAQCSLHVCCSG